jgi:hypothetical protein
MRYCCDHQDLRLIVANRYDHTDQSIPMMSGSTRHARYLRLKAAEITTRRQQLNGHRTAIKRQKERIEDLRQQLLQATASSHAESGDAPPDRILSDTARNKLLYPNGGRYFFDTPTWANKIFATSLVAYRVVRVIFSTPSEELLRQRFLNFKLGIRHDLTYGLCIDELIGIWQKATCFNKPIEAIPAVLAVDGAVLRLAVTTTSLEKSTVFKGPTISSLQICLIILFSSRERFRIFEGEL